MATGKIEEEKEENSDDVLAIKLGSEPPPPPLFFSPALLRLERTAGALLQKQCAPTLRSFRSSWPRPPYWRWRSCKHDLAPLLKHDLAPLLEHDLRGREASTSWIRGFLVVVPEQQPVVVRDPVRGGWATPDPVHGHQAPFYPIRLQQPVRVALDAAPVRAATAALDAATMGGALRARLEQRAVAIAVCEDAEEQQVNLDAPTVPGRDPARVANI